MSLGKNLRYLRKKNKLSQIQLADIIGITERTIYNYEKEQKAPKSSTLKLLAETLGVTPDFLMNANAEKDFDSFMNTKDSKSEFSTENRIFTQPAEFLEYATAMFAGGNLSEEAKDEFFESITQAYFLAKRKAKFKSDNSGE